MLHVRSAARSLAAAFLLSPLLCGSSVGAATAVLPDGRGLSPAGFTIPVEGFASALALSPDERWLAVLGAGSGAIDVLSIDDERPGLVTRLVLPSATGLTWTSDGLYVSCGYSGRIARYAYDAAASKAEPALSKRLDVQTGEGGLLGGIAEDPATHRVAVARSADREVLVLDDAAGSLVARLAATGQPFGVAFAGDAVAATLYDGDSVDVWRAGKGDAVRVRTGPHPTALLADGPRLFVSDADGHDVAAVDVTSLAVTARYELGVEPNQPPGQTPAGMALSDDRRTLFVAESGFNDVAVVDLASARVVARIPTGWYPTDLSFVDRPTIDKDPRNKAQLWIASAKGLGSQPDPGGEWDGSYTGIVQHVVVEPNRFRQWSARVASNDRFGPVPPRRALPPIEHVVFIVRENKHFDEVFGDEPRADADPTLLLYGRAFTPNAHALAERFTLFDDFMGNGESSIYGHAWTTQGFANDYQERNARSRDESTPGVSARVAYSIWPDPVAGDDSLPPAEMNDDWYRDLSDLPAGPRVNVSGVFGPRGELIDALARHGVSFRVYGEQMTMLGDGRIAPGLAAHAARRYPGDHIDFGVLDTERARIFLDDVRAHGLARYSYLTLPTDHTAGTKAGFYTPASYVANNDLALGTIVAALSRRPDWRSTVVFVTEDDPQGTGDHVDAHRMPAFAIGPYVRRSFVDHTRYSLPSFLRTVELLDGLEPLSIEDAAATPMLHVFARTPDLRPYAALALPVPMRKNPGKAESGSSSFVLDGPDSERIPAQEWSSLHGARSLAAHLARLRALRGTLVRKD